ncbi:related to transcription activator amyR [Rhynchosporium agropyri]|uniref:Related to transcription activator amyR n=1 Tax=Rhynchosporium agropyri TaxID=914238 RepID=A0A1E1L4M4_9HELO|nr:related to transcription activator amyR [Rhynchosporium agropyri]
MPPEPAARGSKKAQKIRQACDCCHARKIRCSGDTPCKNCVVTELQCTYLAVPKKKGPKGRRIHKDAKPLPLQTPKIFEQNDPSRTVPLQDSAHPPPGTGTEPTRFSLFNILNPTPFVQSPNNEPSAASSSPVDDILSGFRASPLLTADLVKTCLDAFFTHKYPIMPIMDPDATYAMLPRLHESPEQYGLVAALCALIVFQPEIIDAPGSGMYWPSSQDLINEAVRARVFCDFVEQPSLVTIHTSFLLFAAMFCLQKDNSAWFYIRESMTCLQILRLHEETTYLGLDAEYSKYCRRTFWLLFITERAYALQRHRPLTLQLTIDLPTVNPGPEATILAGFLDLVSLFQHFDESFMSVWNMAGSDSSPQALVQLQEALKTTSPATSDRTEIQQADLQVSRQWLRVLVWQLCVSKGFLSSQFSTESMSFQYPISIARDVVLVARGLPLKAFEANGVGILEKVFDIGCSLSDVLLLNPHAINSSPMEIGPQDYLLEMVRLLGTTPGGYKYLKMLTLKADGILKLKLRGSLSDTDTPDRIEEVFDDEQEVTPGPDDMQFLNADVAVANSDIAMEDQYVAEGFETPGYHPTIVIGDQSLVLSMPTPGWEAFWPPKTPDFE